jgi:hypothetical protein
MSVFLLSSLCMVLQSLAVSPIMQWRFLALPFVLARKVRLLRPPACVLHLMA